MKSECSTCEYSSYNPKYIPCNSDVQPQYYCNLKHIALMDKEVPKDNCIGYKKSSIWT